MQVNCSRYSVLFWRRRNLLRRPLLPVFCMPSCFPIMGHMATSCYHINHTATSCTSYHPCCTALVHSCPRRLQAARLDESIVKGVPKAKYAMYRYILWALKFGGPRRLDSLVHLVYCSCAKHSHWPG